MAAGGSEVTNPAAAWNGSVYLVVWEDAVGAQIYGRRLGANLTPIDAAPLPLLRGNYADVAAIGEVFLAVSSWEEPHEIRQIYSRRVRGSDGALLDPSPRLVGPNFSLFPRVAALSGRWLVVWEEHPTHDDPSSSIRANFIGADGIPGSFFTVDLSGDRPAVAVGPDQAIILWEDVAGELSGSDIMAIRIAPTGALLGPASAVTGEPNDQFDAAVAWDGSAYVAAFGDFRNDGPSDSHRGDLYAARIADSGAVLDPGGFAAMRDTVPEMFPAVAGAGGAFLVGGSVFRQESGYVAYRIGIRASGGVGGVPAADPRAPSIGLAVAPTPTTGAATVTVRLDRADHLTVGIFDLSGREVRRLYQGRLPEGETRLPWDGRDWEQRQVPPGIFFVRLIGSQRTTAVRLVRL